MSQPPDKTDSSAPCSAKRANDVYEACGPLSSDGAAAVLSYARSMVDRNRRFPPVLQHVEIWKFVGVVADVCAEIKDVVYLKGYKRKREFVFVASAYRALLARGDAASMSLAQFKTRILEARADGMMWLARCRNAANVSPLLLEASTVHGSRGLYHLIQREPISDVKHALEHVTHLLPDAARPAVASFARRVHADEALRDGRPRLITLGPEEFALRVQEFVDREPGDMPLATLFWKLEDRGEMTGIDFESFKVRLLAAHRAGRLHLGAQTELIRPDALFMPVASIQYGGMTWSHVRRSSLCPPIPWGPPSPPIIRRLVLQAP